MLFILAMEPLNRLLELATAKGLLSPIKNKMAKLRMSLYADDATVFVNPVREEVQVVAEILTIFGNASGLITNMGKCVVYPIRCDDINLDEVMEGFQCPIKSFLQLSRATSPFSAASQGGDRAYN